MSIENISKQLDQMAIYQVELKDTLHSLHITLAKLEKEVTFHVKRTNQLEDRYLLIASDMQRYKGGIALSGWIFSTLIAVGAVVLRYIGV